MYRIGLISDTHGLLRPEAMAALAGCDHIVHAGDVGAAHVLEGLATLAPVTAIRGNVDTAPWASTLPDTADVVLHGLRVHVLHDCNQLPAAGPPPGTDVIVCGHSHRPGISHRGSVLVVNPGSAGRRRFRLPVTLAELAVEGTTVTPRIVLLLPGAP